MTELPNIHVSSLDFQTGSPTTWSEFLSNPSWWWCDLWDRVGLTHQPVTLAWPLTTWWHIALQLASAISFQIGGNTSKLQSHNSWLQVKPYSCTCWPLLGGRFGPPKNICPPTKSPTSRRHPPGPSAPPRPGEPPPPTTGIFITRSTPASWRPRTPPSPSPSRKIIKISETSTKSTTVTEISTWNLGILPDGWPVENY